MMKSNGQLERDLEGMNGSLSIDNFIYSIHISPKLKYVYVETPKAGCSTIKKTLIRAEMSNPDFVFAGRPQIHRRDLSPLLDPASVEDFPELMRNNGYLKFCFVRNPYVRLLSGYLDKFRRPTEQQEHFKRQTGLRDEISFTDFVHTICGQPSEQMDNHWRGQFEQTLQDHISYDFVGHTETLDEDVGELSERLGFDLAPYYEPERSHAQGAASRLGKFYTAEIVAAVQRKFAKDFEHFGYSLDLAAAAAPSALGAS